MFILQYTFTKSDYGKPYNSAQAIPALYFVIAVLFFLYLVNKVKKELKQSKKALNYL